MKSVPTVSMFLRVTRAQKRTASLNAKRMGLNLTEYVVALIEQHERGRIEAQFVQVKS